MNILYCRLRKKKEFKKFDLEKETQISKIQKQCLNININAIEKEKYFNIVVKTKNCEYMNLWDSLQNDIISGINNVICV